MNRIFISGLEDNNIDQYQKTMRPNHTGEYISLQYKITLFKLRVYVIKNVQVFRTNHSCATIDRQYKHTTNSHSQRDMATVSSLLNSNIFTHPHKATRKALPHFTFHWSMLFLYKVLKIYKNLHCSQNQLMQRLSECEFFSSKAVWWRMNIMLRGGTSNDRLCVVILSSSCKDAVLLNKRFHCIISDLKWGFIFFNLHYLALLHCYHDLWKNTVVVSLTKCNQGCFWPKHTEYTV